MQGLCACGYVLVVMCLWFQRVPLTWHCNQPLSEGRKFQIHFFELKTRQ